MRALTLLLALAPAAHGQDNFLIMMVDDVGVDLIGAYREHPDAGPTPNIDQLARDGVLFRNAWGSSVCSPARAALQTGRYARHNDLGRNIRPNGVGTPGLSLEEVTLPEMLGAGYTSALLGKWHVADPAQGALHPLDSGYDYHAGTLFNLGGSYYSWGKLINGRPNGGDVYATTDAVDEALAWIEAQPGPWLALLSFHAAHEPLNPPPRDLHTFDLDGADENTHARAMVEALDTEVGRLLESLGEDLLARTTIFFVGDNGTSPEVTTAPFDPGHAKDTLYEGGVNIPFIVAGPHVRRPGLQSSALVSLVDVFDTVREIARAGPTEPPTDGVSLVPYLHDPYRPSLRETVYTEWFDPNGSGSKLKHRQAIRGARYKLIHRKPGPDELFDLWSDPFEQNNLLGDVMSGVHRAALGRLTAALPPNLAGF